MRLFASALVAGALLGSPELVLAQDALPRAINLTDGWVGEPGALHFNFDHRFRLVSAADKVLNSPSFLLAAPLPGNLIVGGWYASRSELADGRVNEWETFGRWAPPIARENLGPALSVAYNGSARSVDGELSLRRAFAVPDGVPVDSIALLGSARAFSDVADTGDGGWFWGGGLVLHLRDGLALAGDAGRIQTDGPDLRGVWGAGLQFRVPTTPHTVSLRASNTNTATLQGSAIGGRTSWGFEFTVPITFARYFTGPQSGEDPTASSDGAALVEMSDALDFVPETIRIRPGQTVTWRNAGNLAHTVSADPANVAQGADQIALPSGAAAFDSGLIVAGGAFSHTFTEPGEYHYICRPHLEAGMVGTIIVED
ncbi:MAG: plastocyanin/azurin family copper-binding protein [Gemmatimonadota bacterium]